MFKAIRRDKQTPSLWQTCAQYATQPRTALNDAVALKNSAVPLRWLWGLRPSLVRNVASAMLAFQPRPPRDFHREMKASRWKERGIDDDRFVYPLWPGLHIACAKGFDRVVLCMHLLGSGSRKNAVLYHACLNGFTMFTPAQLAAIEGHVDVLRVLRDKYNVERKNAVSSLTAREHEPRIIKAMDRLFELTADDECDLLQSTCYHMTLTPEQRLQRIECTIEMFPRHLSDVRVGAVSQLLTDIHRPNAKTCLRKIARIMCIPFPVC